MNQSFDVSTIVFAALAIFVVWKLRSVLGTRTGDERPPLNPFVRRSSVKPDDAAQATPEMGKVITMPGVARPTPRPTDEPDRWKGIVERGSPAEDGLDKIAASDPSFTGRSFIDGARVAYEMILTAFAKGDRAALTGLLAKDVLDGFTHAIDERDRLGEKAEVTFVSMDKSVVEDASLRDRTASITVRFESQQINVLRTKSGDIAESSSESVAPVIDHWTFTRTVTARNPNWTLTATSAE